MKLLISLTQIAIFCIGSSVATSTAMAAKLMVDIDLYWKPTTSLSDLKKLDFNSTSSIKVLLTDKRSVTPLNRVGERSENPKEFLPVETKNNIADFVNKGMNDTLKKVGLNITEGESDYVLSGEINEFYVTETNTYQGSFRVSAQLKKSGKVVWEGNLFGKNSRFGRSYKLDNFMESLSDCIIDASYALLENEGFKKGFQTKTGKN